MSVLETEDLVPHLRRVETDQQFPHVVLGPDLEARAMSEPVDAYVLAPPLQEAVFQEEVGFPHLRDLVAACELAQEGRYSEVTFEIEGPDLLITGEGEYATETAIQWAKPYEVGTYVSPEDGEELRSRLDQGQAFPVRHSDLDRIVRAHSAYGVGETRLSVEEDVAAVTIGQPGATHTIPLRGVEWEGEPFVLEVTGSALARAANVIPENVDAEIVLEGPQGHLGLRTEDGYLYAFPHRGE